VQGKVKQVAMPWQTRQPVQKAWCYALLGAHRVVALCAALGEHLPLVIECPLTGDCQLLPTGAGILHSSLQRQMEELTAAGVLHEADFNERVLDALHCLPLANAQVQPPPQTCWNCQHEK
jgi:hypothetical protein